MLLSTGEVARIFGVRPETVRVWACRGFLKSVNTSEGSNYFYKEDVEAYKKVRDAYKNYQSTFNIEQDSNQ